MESRLYITDVAERLNRRVDTVRKWDSQGLLPAALHPRRDERRWRYWTEDQIPLFKEWVSRRIPGSALPGYNPDERRLEQHLDRMRRPRLNSRR